MFLCSFQLLLQILEVAGMWTWWTCPSPQAAPIGRVNIVPLLTNTDTRTAKCAACLKTNPPQKYCWCRRNCGAEEKGSHNITFQERCFKKAAYWMFWTFSEYSSSFCIWRHFLDLLVHCLHKLCTLLDGMNDKLALCGEKMFIEERYLLNWDYGSAGFNLKKKTGSLSWACTEIDSSELFIPDLKQPSFAETNHLGSDENGDRVGDSRHV